MARWRDDLGDLPERLCRFVAVEWAGEADPVGAWKYAALVWLDANPGRLLPFGLDGGPVDVLREAYRLRGTVL